MIQEKGRKQQTREMVADSIRRNEESALANLNLDTDEGRPDDTDDPDDEDEEVSIKNNLIIALHFIINIALICFDML